MRRSDGPARIDRRGRSGEDWGEIAGAVVKYILLGFGILLASVTAGRAADPLPVETFNKRPEIHSVALSPSGRYLATALERGDLHAVVIRDLETKTDSIGLSSKDPRVNITAVWWKGDDRLVAETTQKIDRRGVASSDPNVNMYLDRMVGAQALIGFDRDGGHQVPFVGSGMKETAVRLGFVDGLENDPEHILTRDRRVLYRTDVRTGQSVEIDFGGDHVGGWETNSQGEPVVRFEFHGGTAIEVRRPGTKEWVELTKISRRGDRLFEDLALLGPSEDPSKIYVAVVPKTPAEGQYRNVHLLDLATRQIGPPLWPDLKYDISGIIRERKSDALVGVCYYADVYTCETKSEAYNKDRKALNAFFEAGRNIRVASRSREDKGWVLFVSGPDEPGTYYLFDRTTKKIDIIGPTHPALVPDQLGEGQAYVYKSRDGAGIPAYLTRPPGSAAKTKLPLVVMPHGGPEARDNLDYDRLAQVLATRGYLVLQPNFRGSAGYGLDFRNAGRKQWGRRMQQDIEDGARTLIASGQADPERVCIFGASYGGYAALIGGALTPDLYKCVISFAGVSDLRRMLDYENRGADPLTYEYWTQVIGDPKTDQDVIAAGSPVAYAATYRPPVLLLHGEWDRTVPIEQSEIMDGALRRAGKSVKFVRLPGGHGDQDEANWTKIMTEALEFLKAHIGAGAP